MKRRILYIDIIKVLALLFVIYNHTHQVLISSRMHIRIIHNSLFYLSKSAVPLFFMASGILLMNKNDSLKKIIKRILRVLIPLIIITVIWTYMHARDIDLLQMINPYSINYFPYWLWFLQSMILIYICLPLIRKITLKYENFNIFRILIIGSLIVFSIFFTIFNIIFKKNQLIITNLLPMPFLYFIYGYLLSMKKNKKSLVNISLINLLITLIVPTFIATKFMLLKKSYLFLDDYKNIYSFIIATSLFIIIKYFFENYNKDNIFTKIITHLSNNSYGIYLIHVFSVEFILNMPFIKKLSEFHKLECIFIIITLVIIVNDILISILRQIPGIKKLL